MNRLYTYVHWLPRGIGILGILFISLFSLDVIEPGITPLQIAIGLFMHNIPSFVLISILALAWKHERLGGWLFIAVSVIPFFLLGNSVWVNAVLCAPFLLTGVLFLVSDRAGSKGA